MNKLLYPLCLTAALIGTAAAADTAKCLLVVEGEFYINGQCEFQRDGGGDFTVYSQDREWSASLSINEDGSGIGSWNGDRPGDVGRHSPSRHQHAMLHDLKHEGACWANMNSVLCAW